MSNTFKNTLIQSIREAAVYDSGSLQPPVAILWPDPERQWEAIIDKLQQEMPELLRFAEYDVSKRQGPAIWLKCMVGRTLPEADWDAKLVPVIYLPGIAKSDLRNLSQADPEIAPLMEYQYTGTLWIHRNGKEWTVNAFLQNREDGLGLDVATDHATKDAGIKALPALFEDQKLTYPSFVDADFLYQLLFKNEEQSILEWLCRGDDYFKGMSADKQHVFTSICKKKYGFVPIEKNVISIAEKLGMKNSNEWENVWNHYCLTPHRYPQIEELLEKAKPDSMGEGLFAIPEDTWPPLPSLTPTCKPFFSPMAGAISLDSRCNEFRPQTSEQKDLTTARFEKEMSAVGYVFVRNVSDLDPEKKTWMEIGKIDQHGHQEQLGLVDRIEELCALIEERVQDLFAAGFRKIRIVTDHGWLLVPGGMEKEKLPKDHIETRWGRCALLKEGVPSELLHLPWMWNKGVMIAYAPATSFFKARSLKSTSKGGWPLWVHSTWEVHSIWCTMP